MSQYDANLQPHSNKATNQGDHDSSPGFVHKIADKLGIHKSDKSDDHHKSVAATLHGHKHDEPVSYQTGQYDNDPNRVHPNDPNRVHDKDSKPGIVHKIADKLGIHSDKSDHKGTKVDESSSASYGQKHGELHNYQTGYNRDNDPNRAHHNASELPGFTDKVKSKLGMDKSSDHHKTDATHGKVETSSSSATHGQQQANIDIGGYPVKPTHHDTTNQAHQHNVNSPGFTDKVKSKLGLGKSSDHHKQDDAGNLFGLPASNPNPTRDGQDTVEDFRTQSPGFGAGQPPVAGQTHLSDQRAHESSSILPMSTPQAEAGSVYSSSMIGHAAVPGDHNRQGHSTSTSRDTGHTGRTYQN